MIISKNVGSISILTAVRTRNKDNEDDETEKHDKNEKGKRIVLEDKRGTRSEIVQKLRSHKQDINTFTLFNRFLREHLSERKETQRKKRKKRESQ